MFHFCNDGETGEGEKGKWREVTEAEFAHKTRSHFYAAGRAGKGGIGQGQKTRPHFVQRTGKLACPNWNRTLFGFSLEVIHE